MRTLDRYIFFSYLGPFILTLFISLFVLVMQFLWLYIDDLVGKGLELKVVAEIFYYVILTLVPMALPLAILLSSIMTFGSMGEHYELAALKSSGLSLQRIMKPLVVFSLLLSISAFFFSNNVLPYATLKWRSMIFDVTRQKPAITITEGAFYTGINKYVIRVEKKDPDGKTLRDIMIYDHSAGLGNTRVVIAESGHMEMSEDLKYFIISLRNGHSYDEIADKENGAYHPLVRSTFKEQIMRINLSGFEYNRTDEDLFKSNYEMMNLSQVMRENDTLQKEKQERVASLYEFMKKHSYNKLPVVPVSPPAKQGVGEQPMNSQPVVPPSPLGGNKQEIKSPVYDIPKRANIMSMALTLARSAKMEAQRCAQELQNIDSQERYINIVFHKKFTLSFACMVLFFIGAPLGAIIRKGGLGMPMVVSIILFILYWVISITGEKFSKEGVIPPYVGMWISTFILLPVGIWLTRKATADSTLFDVDVYLAPIRRLFRKKKNDDNGNEGGTGDTLGEVGGALGEAGAEIIPRL